MPYQRKLEQDCTTLSFYEWFVISEPKVGCHIDLFDARNLFDATENYYQHPYCFISNRKHSCSYNPMIYTDSISHESRLASLAIVCGNDSTCSIAAKTEVLFAASVKPFALFESVEDAVVWSRSNLIDLLSAKSVGHETLRLQLDRGHLMDISGDK